jgi:hypothetical protein
MIVLLAYGACRLVIVGRADRRDFVGRMEGRMVKRKRRGNPRIKEIGIKTRFKPGQSGNPSGRAKNCVLSDMLDAIGNEIEPKSGKTFFQLAAEALLNKAFHGDIGAFRELADRVEGKPRQRVEVTGAEGSPFIPGQTLESVQKRIEELLALGGYRAGRAPQAAKPAAGK